MATPPPIIERCGDLLARYDVLFCDVWGVIHDGRVAFPGANDALTRFRAKGGTVILVSNAPMPGETVAKVIDDKGVVRSAWDRIVSSGDIALRRIRDMGYSRTHQIGRPGYDRDFFAAVGHPGVEIASADAIACTGLRNERKERAEDYRQTLVAARARNLPFVCANPDYEVHVGQDLLPCAGAIAALYESLGGEVYWAGKPHKVAYGTAFEVAAAVRGAPVSPSRVLALGDTIRTDLAAAAGAGVDAFFIASGIHRDEAMDGGRVSPDGLARLFAGETVTAVAAASAVVW